MNSVQQCQGNLVGQMLSLLWCKPASMLACLLHLLLMFKILCHAHNIQMAGYSTLPKQCLRKFALYRQHSQLQHEDLESMQLLCNAQLGQGALLWPGVQC